MILLLYLVFIAVVFSWLIKETRSGKYTRGKAIGLYATCSVAPVVLYGLIFILLIGLEELTGSALIGEGYARSLPFVIVGGLLVTLATTLVFSLVIYFIKQR